MPNAIYSLAISLWCGGLWITGASTWALFRTLNNNTLAGSIAGILLHVVAWVGVACGAYLLAFLMVRRKFSALKSSVFWLVLVMLLLTLAGYFGIQPILAALKAEALPLAVMQSVVKDRFNTWHGISSGLYVLQCLLGVGLVLLQERGR